MPRPNAQHDEFDDLEPAVPGWTLALMFIGAAGGAMLAVFVLPAMAPGLTESLLGAAPKAYWYLSRSSAFVAYVLLWMSMAFGLIITNKMSRAWPGGPRAFDLHQFTSLLGLAFGLFHALILMGDQYTNYTLVQVLMPFQSTQYRPLWVGIGQLGFYSLFIVGMTFYVRKSIGQKLWRWIHYLSFLAFSMALIHGIFSGTDSGSVWIDRLYWGTGASLLFLFMYRMLIKNVSGRPARSKRGGEKRRRSAEAGRGRPQAHPRAVAAAARPVDTGPMRAVPVPLDGPTRPTQPRTARGSTGRQPPGTS